MALDFNGSTDKLLNDTTAALAAVPCTLAGWCKPDVNNAVQRVCGCYSVSALNPIISIVLLNDGLAYAEFRNDTGGAGNSSAPASTTPYSTTEWQHVAATIDSSGVARVFYNGVMEAVGATPSNATVTLNATSVGMRKTTTENHFFNGGLAETAMWTGILSDDQIMKLARKYAPTWFMSGLVHYRSLIDDGVRPYIGPALTLTGTGVIAHPAGIIYPPQHWIG